MKKTAALQMKMEQYVRTSLLRELGHQGKKFSLEATALGIHNQVFFLAIEGKQPLVIKGITKRQRFQTSLNCSRHLLSYGIRIPRILYAHADHRLFNRLGMHVICEERITGKTLFESPNPEELIPIIARFFSQMHGITRATWGKIDKGQKNGLYEYLLERTSKKLNAWQQQQQKSLPPSWSHQCIKWMKDRRAAVQAISLFSLSHGDPNPGNIIFSTDGSMFLLDTGHIRYLPRAIDFYTLVVHCCQDNQEHIRLFEENYFAAVASGEKERFFASHLFFKLYVLIDFGQNLVCRLATVDRGHPWHQEFITSLQKIKNAVAETLDH